MATTTDTTSSALVHDPVSAISPQCSPPSATITASSTPTPVKQTTLAQVSIPNNHSPVCGPAPREQEQEPDANVDEIMQHPLWAKRGSQLLSSQDMDKQNSIDYRSHRTDEQRDHKHPEAAVKKDMCALLSLMLVMPFVGIAICFYALVVFLAITLAVPVLLIIAGRAALKRRYLCVLFPALNLHYRMAYSSRRCHPEAPASAPSWPGSVSVPQSPSSSGFSDLDEKLMPTPSIAMLMTVLLFSPILSLPIAMANFTIMFFWFMSAVTESASSGSSMDDGRKMAKRVRRFWVRWLSGELGQSNQRKRRTQRVSRV